MYPAGNLLIPAPHGQLEAIYRPSRKDAARVALVLHPHPLHGGTMHNKVVFRAARALTESGFETLRFNFRGVGQSTGQHDHGEGECDDARIALDYLLADQPMAREVIVAGFSFGSIVGLRVGCADPRVHRLIAIGAPARLARLDTLRECAKPTLFVHGAEDEIAPFAPLEEMLRSLPPGAPRTVVRIDGAGHFFDNHAEELMRAIRQYVGPETSGADRPL